MKRPSLFLFALGLHGLGGCDTQTTVDGSQDASADVLVEPETPDEETSAEGKHHQGRSFWQEIRYPEEVPESWPVPGARDWSGRDGYAMVWVDGGQGSMASPTDETVHKGDREEEWGPDAELPEEFYEVMLTRGYYTGTTEVTQGLWKKVMGENPSETGTLLWNTSDMEEDNQAQSCASLDGRSLVGDELPVMCITWRDAVAFANALSLRDGLVPAYEVTARQVIWVFEANGYRLPTEAEWERAARAGDTLKYAGTTSTDDICSYANVSDETTRSVWSDWHGFNCNDGFAALAPVGSLKPNGYGLYDMTGNVFEWTWDVYQVDRDADQILNPVTSSGHADQIRHGGGWTTGRPLFARVARRCAASGENRDFGLGLRLFRSHASESL